APWSQQESRSMPGRFYFVNQETGSRTWEPWFRQESRSSPGRFYFINALTGESTWEPPTRHWKEVTAETHSPSALRKIPQVTNEEFEPPEPCSVDYRDEAFSDSNRIIVATPAMKSTNSGPGLGTILSCSHGSQGVKSLSMAALVDDWEQSLSTMAGKSFPPVADCVIGSQLTWVKGPLIGRGSLGRVFKAADQQTGRILAVKEIPINTMNQRDEQFKQQLENEVSIMKDLRHPHIVAYLGHDYLDQCLYMYLEHMPGGTITQALHEFGPFEESLTAKYSRQILEGLDYLHTRDPPVIHRDIKGSNILIGDGSVVKLADFGCSKRTDETLTHTMRGSIPWMAPEVLAHSRYGRAADIWSFGCVVIEMGTANVPWGRFDHQMAALVKIGLSNETPPYPEGVSETCISFLDCCIRREQDERLGAKQLLEHEFVRFIDPDEFDNS
ncbi:unnamed protein product, partial [Polarella glacialis]